MIYFISNQLNSRVEYAVSFLFTTVLQQEMTFLKLDSVQVFPENSIFYGENISGTFPHHFLKIPQHALMVETGVQPQTILVKRDAESDLPYFFSMENEQDTDWPFDLLAMIFYLLSRYEEYLPYEKDRYGRFMAAHSHAWREGFLGIPLVDLWIQQLVNKYPWLADDKNSHKKGFKIDSTIDVDMVWAFAHRGYGQWKGVLKDLILGRINNLKRRLKSIQSSENDPFFTFSYLDNIHQDNGKTPTYFVLFSKFPDYRDINHKRDKKEFTKWLENFSKEHVIGLHPSFQSHQSLAGLKDEKETLETVIQKEINFSRQHFIYFTMPHTFQNLIKVGIREDFSMGYPDHIGYRASTGHTHFWYDLKEEKSTSLKLHPFQVMDVTLKKYMGYTPDEAIQKMEDMFISAQNAGSPFRFIWHNSSFYEGNGWKGWYKVFEYLMKYKIQKDTIS